jgi:hypothetical protein
MTVTRATTTRPLVRDVRPARGRRRVGDAESQAASKGIRATMIPVDDTCRVGGSPNVTRHSSRQPGKTATSLVVPPFKLQ